jgi:hypothetical protein
VCTWDSSRPLFTSLFICLFVLNAMTATPMTYLQGIAGWHNKVRLVLMYGNARGSVRLYSVRLCDSVCVSARGCMRQCMRRRCVRRQCVRQCVPLCGSAHGSVWQSLYVYIYIYIYIYTQSRSQCKILVCPYKYKQGAVGLSPMFRAC